MNKNLNIKNYFLLSLLALSMAVVSSSCSKNSENGEVSKWTNAAKSRVSVSSDVKNLSTRISFTASSTIAQRGGVDNPSFFEFARLNSLSLGGDILSATNVQTQGNYAIVSYHNHYQALGGAIELIDIADPSNPKVISSLTYSDRDFNHITFDRMDDFANSKFWVLGDDSQKGKCYLIEGKIANGRIDENLKEMSLQGTSANCAVKFQDYLLVATTGVNGIDGGFFAINMNDEDEIISRKASRAKHIAVDPTNTDAAFVCFEINEQKEGILSYFDNVNQLLGSPKASYNLGKLETIDGKNSVRLYDNTAYVALSDQGFVAVDVLNGNIIMTQANADKGLANGIDADNNYIYVANGSAGMKVYNKTNGDLAGEYPNTSGIANYTSVNEAQNLLFLANGTEGVRIFCIDGCTIEPACVDFLNEIPLLFPNDLSVFSSETDYIKNIFADGSNMPKCIEATAATSIFVTFAKEDAGFANSLGYFIVPSGQDPVAYYQNTLKNDIILEDGVSINPNYVIFDHVADVNNPKKDNGTLKSGESFVSFNDLNAGDKLYFFLLPEGYFSGTVKRVRMIHDASHMPLYDLITTLPAVNEFADDNRPKIDSFDKLMHVMFYSQTCKSFILMFEDNYSNYFCDSDYNDCIFSVSDNRIGETPSRIKMSL